MVRLYTIQYIHFHHSKPLNHTDIQPSEWYDIPENLLVTFDVHINQQTLIEFVDAGHAIELQKQQSITGLFYTFCDDYIVYKLKTQPLTARSSTEAEFIATHTTLNIERYL